MNRSQPVSTSVFSDSVDGAAEGARDLEGAPEGAGDFVGAKDGSIDGAEEIDGASEKDGDGDGASEGLIVGCPSSSKYRCRSVSSGMRPCTNEKTSNSSIKRNSETVFRMITCQFRD
jgi:hypothetical protein